MSHMLSLARFVHADRHVPCKMCKKYAWTVQIIRSYRLRACTSIHMHLWTAPYVCVWAWVCYGWVFYGLGSRYSPTTQINAIPRKRDPLFHQIPCSLFIFSKAFLLFFFFSLLDDPRSFFLGQTSM